MRAFSLSDREKVLHMHEKPKFFSSYRLGHVPLKTISLTIFMTKAIILSLLFCCLTALPNSVKTVYAADWLTLIGTEPAGRDFKLWGIVQTQYVHDYGDSLEGLTGKAAKNNGKLVVKNTVGPWHDEREGFSIRRLRAGVRGRFTGRFKNSFTEKMNYFFMVETGQNRMTYEALGDRVRPVALSDVFLTFNHIPGMRIQTGLFKNPGPEETMQPAGFLGDYIQFTDFMGKEYLELFSKGNAPTFSSIEGGQPETIGVPQTTSYGFTAARDWGIQAFNTLNVSDKWDLSWAFKLGRGESISTLHAENHTPELYLYSSAEYKLPGGKGPAAHGIKFYSWFQGGQRTFSTDPEDRDFDRYRYGLGSKALGKFMGLKQRLTFDFMLADGMIFLSTTGKVKGGLLQYATDTGNRTRGITVDYGIYISKWQLNYRWHWHDILYDTDGRVWTNEDHRIATEHTIGLRYNFTKQIRIICDFMIQDVKAPDNEEHNVVTTLDSVGNRVAVQFTWIL